MDSVIVIVVLCAIVSVLKKKFNKPSQPKSSIPHVKYKVIMINVDGDLPFVDEGKYVWINTDGKDIKIQYEGEEQIVLNITTKSTNNIWMEES